MMAKTTAESETRQSLRIELAVRSDIERFLRAAVRLAKMMDTGLEVVFRQDREMLDAVALPFVQEVCLWTGEERLTSRSLLASSMRIQARQTRKLLAHIAEREAVAYTFTSEQEERNAEDGQAESSVQWVGGRCLSTRTEHCPVCVLMGQDEEGRRSLSQAADFARRTGRDLKVFSLGRTPAPQEPRLNQHVVAVADLGDWLRQSGQMDCYVLFMPKALYVGSAEMKAVHGVPYPVLLV